jgi:citrate lyase subunit beta / citryl-CoA lyase
MPIGTRLRSLLFVPGDDGGKLAKAAHAPADALLVDWEDSVASQNKAKARAQTIKFTQRGPSLRQAMFIRINSVCSSAFEGDSESICECAVDGIMLSKCASADDVRLLEQILNSVDMLKKCCIYPLIESPSALINASSIATASDRVAALAFGAEDFSTEMDIVRSEDEIELLYARSYLVTHSRAAGRDTLDSPCIDFHNPERLRAAGTRARRLGFTGKLAIHPSQVAILNEVFSPSEEELKRASRMIAAASPNTGVFSFDGSMVDEPILRQARKVLQK